MKNGSGRILLIEDEATSREISLLVLEGAGYEIEAANCAVAAHQRLSSAPYSLVIADWLLPDGDGLGLAESFEALAGALLFGQFVAVRWVVTYRGCLPSKERRERQPIAQLLVFR